MLRSVARCGYRVQVIDGVRACRYDTLYYDTAERDMYLVHHNQQLTRQKIRTRLYVETEQAFLEIKNKTNRGRTKKSRIAISHSELSDFSSGDNSSKTVAFYNKNARYAIGDVTPALATRFTRITLVNPELTERLTIDLGLSYEDLRTRSVGAIRSMAIVELKQDGNTLSTMKRILRDMHIAPLKVSKYCLGTALTVEGIKKNRFKLKIRDIEKRLNIDNSCLITK